MSNITLLPTSPAQTTTEADEILEDCKDTYTTLALVGTDSVGNILTSYTALHPATLLMYAEVLRAEALESLMLGTEE